MSDFSTKGHLTPKRDLPAALVSAKNTLKLSDTATRFYDSTLLLLFCYCHACYCYYGRCYPAPHTAAGLLPSAVEEALCHRIYPGLAVSLPLGMVS